MNWSWRLEAEMRASRACSSVLNQPSPCCCASWASSETQPKERWTAPVIEVAGWCLRRDPGHRSLERHAAHQGAHVALVLGGAGESILLVKTHDVDHGVGAQLLGPVLQRKQCRQGRPLAGRVHALAK